MLRRAAGVALAGAAVAAAMSTPAWSQESSQQRGEIPLVVNQSQAALNTLVGTADMRG